VKRYSELSRRFWDGLVRICSTSSPLTPILVSRFALVVFFAWVALANLAPTTGSDVWTNLKVGEQILEEWSIPAVERYSVTAEGRPFIAFEWLSSVIFASVNQLVGATGLTLLLVFIGLACAVLLHRSIPPDLRGRAAVLPLLILTTYLLCFRTFVRPHLFTLMMICLLSFSLERWRRSRRLAEIAWLIPLHALWVNLHGAYLFGVVLLGLVSAVVGGLALFPRLQRSADETFSGRDFVQLAGVAAASAVMCLVNPYGFSILEFSLRMSEANQYIKEAIWEWRSPFVTGGTDPWFVVYCAELVLLWISVLGRLRRRPWLDAVIALVISFQSARANRFVPYLGILGLPIMARFWCAWATAQVPAGGRQLRLLLDGALVALLVITAAGPGAAFGPRAFRPLGFGFGGPMAYQEVAAIRRMGLRGNIYNEYRDGALIIYALYPLVRPVMDARIDVYGERLWREYVASRSSRRRFLAYLRKYQLNLALLYDRPENRAMIQALQNRSDWSIAYRSSRRVLFARKTPPGGGPEEERGDSFRPAPP
jgi:hypothetical protein